MHRYVSIGNDKSLMRGYNNSANVDLLHNFKKNGSVIAVHCIWFHMSAVMGISQK